MMPVASRYVILVALIRTQTQVVRLFVHPVRPIRRPNPDNRHVCAIVVIVKMDIMILGATIIYILADICLVLRALPENITRGKIVRVRAAK